MPTRGLRRSTTARQNSHGDQTVRLLPRCSFQAFCVAMQLGRVCKKPIDYTQTAQQPDRRTKAHQILSSLLLMITTKPLIETRTCLGNVVLMYSSWGVVYCNGTNQTKVSLAYLPNKPDGEHTRRCLTDFALRGCIARLLLLTSHRPH